MFESNQTIDQVAYSNDYICMQVSHASRYLNAEHRHSSIKALVN